VRLHLPLTPPQGTDMPHQDPRYRGAGTKEPSDDTPRLNTSASQWKKTDLAKLGVDYQCDRLDEIVFGDVAAELLQGSYLCLNIADL
jgi:hypothetical protein